MLLTSTVLLGGLQVFCNNKGCLLGRPTVSSSYIEDIVYSPLSAKDERLTDVSAEFNVVFVIYVYAHYDDSRIYIWHVLPDDEGLPPTPHHRNRRKYSGIIFGREEEIH